MENPAWKTSESAHTISPKRSGQDHRGRQQTGEKLIDQAEKIDPKGDEELAEEVKRDRENAERFVERQ